jgi:uncharacterized protein (DUF2267 family)
MSNKEEINNIEKSEKVNDRVSVFESSLHKSEAWITEMHNDLSWLSRDKVYHLLRAVLHALRDQLSVDEAAHFTSQLPLVLRGTFYECWNPKTKNSKGLTKQDFLETIRNNFDHSDRLNFDLETGVSIALGVIMNHISPGEMEDVIQSSKPSLKMFFETVENFSLKRKYQ